MLYNQRLSVTDPENTYPKRIRRAIRLFINPPENELEKHIIGKGIICEEPSRLYRQAASATVLIRSGGGIGAGVFIAPRVIVTADHVLAGQGLAVFVSEIPNGSLAVPTARIQAKGKWHVPGLDLAFVTTNRDGPSWLYLDTGFVSGPELMIVGHPKGKYYSLQKARIKRKDSLTLSEYIFFKDNEIFFGNSGGGIIGCNGNLMGVVSMMRNYDNSMFKEGVGINARTILKNAKSLNLL